MDEEEQRKIQKSYELGQDLSLLSVTETDEIIEVLKQEIVRLEESRAEKSAHLSAAEALFKS